MSVSLSVKKFNDRIKTMNQTGGRQLCLSADEARNLHTDIYNMLSLIVELQGNQENAKDISADLDGGKF